MDQNSGKIPGRPGKHMAPYTVPKYAVHQHTHSTKLSIYLAFLYKVT